MTSVSRGDQLSNGSIVNRFPRRAVRVSVHAQRRQTGKQRPSDREPVLGESWLAVIKQLGAKELAIGGKSMGGRIASLVADEAGVAGLVC